MPKIPENVELPDNAVEVGQIRKDEYDNIERIRFNKVGDVLEGKLIDSFEGTFKTGFIVEKDSNTAKMFYANKQLAQKLNKVDNGTNIKIVLSQKINTGNSNSLNIFLVYEL